MDAEDAADSDQQRHQRADPWSLRVRLLSAAAIITVATSAAVLAFGAVSRGAGGGIGSCRGNGSALTIAVAPELAGPVAATIYALQASKPDLSGNCSGFTVTARAGAEVAAALSVRNGPRPDVWIPDSSVWVRQAAAAGWVPPRKQPSIALSPVVLAVPRVVAEQLGWPRRQMSVPSLLQPAARRLVRFALPDVQQSAPTIGAMIAVQDALRSRPPGALASVLRRAAGKVPREPARALRVAAASGTVLPLSEQALWMANRGAGAGGAEAVYPPDGMTLDYPFVVVNRAAWAADSTGRLLTSLRLGAGQDELLAAGFRDPSNGSGRDLHAARGVDPRPASRAVPTPAAVQAAIRAQQAVDAPSRVLAVIDVSGSMGAQVPGTGGRTRLDLVTSAASRGLGLYPDQAELGLWIFATDLTATTDYRQLVRLGPLAARPDGIPGRERLVQALAQVRRVPGGSTGLYDTTLAAVRAVRQGWDARRANSVVLLTDGRNDDPRGIGLSELVSTLRREGAAGQRVPVNIIAYGEDSDEQELAAVARATGGQVYPARDPARIATVFLDAIGRRACPASC